MSFYDDASLVFLPSGEAGKDGKAYSMKPTDGSGDFTFSRGSNLTATRVDSNGLIEKGRENLLLQSNQFDTTWVTSNASVTSGQSGYDGSSDAWELNSSGASPRIQQVVSSSGVSTFSVYAKASTDSFIQIRAFMSPSGDASIWVNLSSGTITNTSGSAYVDSNITSVGNGWYRCSLTINGSLSYLRIYPASAFGTYSTSGNGVYIQDAQVEQGLVATEYIKSGATTGLGGILEDSPRFDYSGGASCPSLLLEPSRTNEIGYSEYFEGWTQQGSPTITTNYGTSPEGLQNSSRLKYTTDSDYIETSVTNTSGVFSIYAKGTGNIILTDSGANASSTTALTSSYQRIDLYFSTNTTTLQIKTDSSGLDAEVYGAQFENATYKTSYIPNHSGGSVTREAESFEKTGLSSVIGQTEGTIFFEFEYSHQQINIPFFRVLENASNFYEIIALSGFKLRSRARIGGSVVANITTSSVVSEGTHKAAIIYKSRDYKFYLDGSLVGSSTESSIVSNPSEINYFDNNNNLKQFLIFPTALSDADCITLTS